MIRRIDLQHEATRADHSIERVPRSDGEIRQVTPALLMVRFKSGGDNHIVVRQWDGTNEGSQDILVAMDPQLQKQIVGTGYTYSNFQTRTRDSDGRAEFINPAYAADQVMFIALADCTNVIVGEEEEAQDVVFVEMKPVRHWSKAC